MDDVTLGKLLIEAHRGQADYCDPEGVSVSQSSLSVVFDRAGKPTGERDAGERDVDQSIGHLEAHRGTSTITAIQKACQSVSRRCLSCSIEHTQPAGERDVDQSIGNLSYERDSSNAQIRTLLHERTRTVQTCKFI